MACWHRDVDRWRLFVPGRRSGNDSAYISRHLRCIQHLSNGQSYSPVICLLTLWRPLLPYRYSYKASCTRPPFVKWKKDEHCSLVTLLTACLSCIGSNLCSIWLKTGQNLFYLRLLVLINTLCSESAFTSVNLRGWGGDGDGDSSDGDGVGMGTEAVGMGVGMGFVFTGTGGDGVQFLFPCRPLIGS